MDLKPSLEHIYIYHGWERDDNFKDSLQEKEEFSPLNGNITINGRLRGVSKFLPAYKDLNRYLELREADSRKGKRNQSARTEP